MKKYTQKDLVVLYIAGHHQVGNQDWIPAFKLAGQNVKGKFTGSQSDRRMLEVMEVVKNLGYWEVDGIRYRIEQRRNGKYKEYRIKGAEEKPKRRVILKDGVAYEIIPPDAILDQYEFD